MWYIFFPHWTDWHVTVCHKVWYCILPSVLPLSSGNQNRLFKSVVCKILGNGYRMWRRSSQISLKCVFEFTSNGETSSQGCVTYSALRHTATWHSAALLAECFFENTVFEYFLDSCIQSRNTCSDLANGYQYTSGRTNWK